MHLGVFPDQPWTKQIVQAAHHQPAKQDEADGFEIVPGGRQDDGGRHPDQGGTHCRNNRKRRHHRCPEYRGINAHRSKCQARQSTLEHTNQGRSFQGGPGHRGKAVQQAADVMVKMLLKLFK